MRAWRAAADLTTAEAGERVGLSRRTIEDIEQGRIRVDDELTRAAIAQSLAPRQRSQRKNASLMTAKQL